MSGALPPTPHGDASGGQGAALHLPAFEKAGPKLFYGKVLGYEQSEVNIEYSVFASNRLLFGRTASGSGKNLSVLADFVLIKPVCFISAESFRLRRNIFNKIRFCTAKAYLLKKLNKSEPWRANSALRLREQRTFNFRHAMR